MLYEYNQQVLIEGELCQAARGMTWTKPDSD